MAAAANDFKAIAAPKRLLTDSKYRSLPLKNALFDRPRLEWNRRPGAPQFFATRKTCLSRRRKCKHLTSCFAKSFLELETSSDRDGLDFVIRPWSGSRSRKSRSISRFFLFWRCTAALNPRSFQKHKYQLSWYLCILLYRGVLI